MQQLLKEHRERMWEKKYGMSCAVIASVVFCGYILSLLMAIY